MTLVDLIKNHQHRKRLKQILGVFAEQGFGYLISKIKLSEHLPLTKRIKARIIKEKDIPLPVRLRIAFEKLGPTFVKFGQLLSLRLDLVPPEYVAEFEKMQDKVPAFPYSQAKDILEKELGRPVNKVFSDFPKTSIASASVAQVYKAKIKNQVVAVKVQRPNIKKLMKVDIEIMYKLADLLEYYLPELKDYHLKEIIHEFEKWTIKELNFRIEAFYSQKISQNFGGSQILKVPKVYLSLTTERVLTMEFLEGIPFHEIEKLKKKRINIKKIVRNGYYIILKQVFIDGLFHADPHPGNILILKEGKIGLIDFGIVGHFDKKLKQTALELFRSVINNEPEKAAKTILNAALAAETFDVERFNLEIKEIFEELQYTALKDIKIGYLLEEVLALINKYHLKAPVDLVLFGKTIVTLEGVALKYQPNFNLIGESRSTLNKLLDHTYFVKEVLQKTRTKMEQYRELAEVFPEYTREILEKARQFKFNLDLEDTDIRNLTLEMERSSGNLSLGLMVAALIVGSALLMQTTRFTFLYTAGFILAGLLGLWLIHRTIFVKIRKEEQ